MATTNQTKENTGTSDGDDDVANRLAMKSPTTAKRVDFWARAFIAISADKNIIDTRPPCTAAVRCKVSSASNCPLPKRQAPKAATAPMSRLAKDANQKPFGAKR